MQVGVPIALLLEEGIDGLLSQVDSRDAIEVRMCRAMVGLQAFVDNADNKTSS